MRIKLVIAYDGTSYCGWQVQPRGDAIQGFIQKVLEQILKHPVALTGAGRTDAGVHALGQVAHFDTPRAVSLEKLCLSLNALLPLEIRILHAEEIFLDFHARYSARAKIYHYHFHLERAQNPFTRLYRTPIFSRFDCSRLSKAASFLIGTHDFTSFANERGKGSNPINRIRTLTRADVIEETDGVRLEFEGNGFLYKMVRNLSGTLAEIAQNRRSMEEIPFLLLQKDRRLAGPTAPAQGLFLHSVKYEI